MVEGVDPASFGTELAQSMTGVINYLHEFNSRAQFYVTCANKKIAGGHLLDAAQICMYALSHARYAEGASDKGVSNGLQVREGRAACEVFLSNQVSNLSFCCLKQV